MIINISLKNQLYIYYNIHKQKIIDKANERKKKLKKYRHTQHIKLKLLNTQL